MAFKISEAFIDVKPKLNEEAGKMLQSQAVSGLGVGASTGDSIVVQNVQVTANSIEEFINGMQQIKQKQRAK